MRLRALPLMFVMLPGLVHAADAPKPWLPKYVESAEVVSVTGHCGTFVQPGLTCKLSGFVLYPSEREGHPPIGIVSFVRGVGQTKYGETRSSAAVMAAAPMKQHRIVRKPRSNRIKGIELRAEYKKLLGGSVIGAPPASSSSPPVPATEIGERRLFRATTRVNIQPGSLDPRQGRMWIVHEDDLHGGFVYAIQLKCVLSPELFPQE